MLFWCRYFKPDATLNAARVNTATFIPSQLDCSQTARNSARLWVWISHPNGLKSKYAYSSSKETLLVRAYPLKLYDISMAKRRRLWSNRASLIRDFLVSSSALINFLTTTLLLSGSFAVKSARDIYYRTTEVFGCVFHPTNFTGRFCYISGISLAIDSR